MSEAATPVAIVGASARAAAFSVLRNGRAPWTADLFADADLARCCPATVADGYPHGFARWLADVAAEQPGLHWLYTGALENHPPVIDRLGEIAPLMGNSGSVVRAVRSPLQLAAALASAGLAFPETRASAEHLPRDGSWLAKTYRGSSGSGVAALAAQDDGHSGCVFQRRVPGRPAAALFVGCRNPAAARAELLGVTWQLVGETWTGAGPFTYCGSIGPAPLNPDQIATVKKIGRTLADKFRLVGLFGVDLAIDRQDIWTLEVNPRYSASVEICEQVTGASAIDAHVRTCLHSLGRHAPAMPVAETPRPPETVRGKAVIYAHRTLAIENRVAAQLLDEAGDWTAPSLGDLPPSGTIIAAGQPVLTVFAASADAATTYQRLVQRTSALRELLGDLPAANPAEPAPCV